MGGWAGGASWWVGGATWWVGGGSWHGLYWSYGDEDRRGPDASHA